MNVLLWNELPALCFETGSLTYAGGAGSICERHAEPLRLAVGTEPLVTTDPAPVDLDPGDVPDGASAAPNPLGEATENAASR